MSAVSNKFENITASFNASTLPLRQRTIDHVLLSKTEGFIVFFLSESKNQLTGYREFESLETFDHFLFNIPMNHALILVYKEDNHYTTGVRFSDESWSHKYDGITVEMLSYNCENYPLEIPKSLIMYEIKQEIMRSLLKTN
jgi:hypothetical protein